LVRVKIARHTLSEFAGPLRAFLERFAFGALLAMAMLLLILGKADVKLIDYLSTRIADRVTPVLSVLIEPVAASRRVARNLGEMFAVYEENARLREQNRRLLEWQSAAQRLLLENAALREALNATPEPDGPVAVTARVVTDPGGPFVQTVLVNAGTDQGVIKGMAAINDRGLVGRVIEAGARSARVMLLTDFNSRVPVMVEPSRDRAILAGDNTRAPRLIFLPLNPRLSLGDQVVTSGQGGVLPPGLPVGRVSALGETTAQVTPYADWERLDYLRLLAYAEVPTPEPSATGEDGAPGGAAVPAARREGPPGAMVRREAAPGGRGLDLAPDGRIGVAR
jgi:rod shape-determining protein MreC